MIYVEFDANVRQGARAARPATKPIPYEDSESLAIGHVPPTSSLR
jgi:hypothetical protein